MFEKVDDLLWAAKIKWMRFTDRFLHEEKGASDIVAILVVIVVVLAVGALFNKQLQKLVGQVFKKATTWVSEN